LYPLREGKIFAYKKNQMSTDRESGRMTEKVYEKGTWDWESGTCGKVGLGLWKVGKWDWESGTLRTGKVGE
jgi:hypothetical protein